MNWRDQYRDRDKALAAEIPAEKFLGCLEGSDEFPSGHFLVGDEEKGYRVSLWHRERGLYRVRSHSDAYYFALVEYLLANKALCFTSVEEAVKFAQSQDWSKAG